MKPTTKKQKVEASIVTRGRFRNGDGKYTCTLYDAKSNTTLEENKFVYSRRFSAKRGAERFAKKNQLIITRWVK